MGLFKDIVTLFTKEKEECVPATREPAPCGQDKVHYHWTKDIKGPCPICWRQRKRKKELEEDERKAKLLAKCIAKELREQQQ